MDSGGGAGGTVAPQGKTSFNSIEWILGFGWFGLISVSVVLSIPLNGFLVTFSETPPAHPPAQLSIPLNGFAWY